MANTHTVYIGRREAGRQGKMEDGREGARRGWGREGARGGSEEAINYSEFMNNVE